jgi:hypothetical protein
MEMTHMTTTMQVGTEILKQLGGHKFIAMTGCNTFTTTPVSLSFRLSPNSSKGTIMRITLTPNDTYTVEVLRLRRCEIVTVSKTADVYAANLQETFTYMTGLATSLGGAA